MRKERAAIAGKQRRPPVCPAARQSLNRTRPKEGRSRAGSCEKCTGWVSDVSRFSIGALRSCNNVRSLRLSAAVVGRPGLRVDN